MASRPQWTTVPAVHRPSPSDDVGPDGWHIIIFGRTSSFIGGAIPEEVRDLRLQICLSEPTSPTHTQAETSETGRAACDQASGSQSIPAISLAFAALSCRMQASRM